MMATAACSPSWPTSTPEEGWWRPRSGGRVPPAEHPERAEGVPPARCADFIKIKKDPTRVDVIEQPPAVRLLPGPHDLDRLCHPGVEVVRSRQQPDGRWLLDHIH